MCVSVFAPVVPSIFLLVLVLASLCGFSLCLENVCALGFWVLLSHQLLCDVDQAQQMLRPSFNAAMSAPLMYIFFICFCVPARLIRWLTINTYIHTLESQTWWIGKNKKLMRVFVLNMKVVVAAKIAT